MSAMQPSGLSIEAIPAFTDNYIWLIHRGGTACAVVDPGDSEPVLEELKRRNMNLAYILITHHHSDHIGGVSTLMEQYPGVQIFAPEDRRISFGHTICHEGDNVPLPEMGLNLSVLEVPAHTRSHIAYTEDGILFCGDTLFSVGCGRLFEGTPEQMQSALDKFAQLPADTRVYCTHEYTESNCEFAIRVEPGNEALARRYKQVRSLREDGEMTLPVTIGEEMAVNPFMRTRVSSVVEAARKIDPAAQPGAPVMGVIRRWKDNN